MDFGFALHNWWSMNWQVILGRAFFVIWTALVWLVTWLVNGHYMWNRVEAKMIPYHKQELAALQGKLDATKELNATLLATVERLTQVQNTATSAASAIKEAVKT